MEDAIRKIKGVQNVTINFMAQKLILEAEDDLFDDVLRQAQKACKKVEPDCTIVL